MPDEFTQLFARAPEEVRAAAVRLKVKKGEPILRLHERNRSLYLLLEGEADVYTENNNNYSTTLRTYRAGEFFGEMELFDEERTALAVIAKKDSTLLQLHRDYVLLWMKKDFEFTMAMCRKLCSNDYGGRVSTNGMKPLPLKDRYLYLLYQSMRFGELDELTKADLCTRLGTDIRCVNRIVAGCREEGIARYENRRFHIMDKRKLCALLDERGLL